MGSKRKRREAQKRDHEAGAGYSQPLCSIFFLVFALVGPILGVLYKSRDAFVVRTIKPQSVTSFVENFDLGDSDVQVQVDEEKPSQWSHADIVRCPLIPTPHPQRKQRCCELVKGRVSCLPNLVVIGAQKAGTTPLHSFLLFHPNLQAALSKELHMFDVDANFNELPKRYAEELPSFDADSFEPKQSIVFETTPSYIADVKGCKRMAKYLPEDARFVLLLREPVERAWSDILMKRRRVIDQTYFLDQVLPMHAASFARCIKECDSSCEAEVFFSCLPEQVLSAKAHSFYLWITSKHPLVNDFVRDCLSDPRLTKQCIQEKYENRIPGLSEKLPVIPDCLWNEGNNLTSTLRGCCQDMQGRLPDDDHECSGCGCECFPRPEMMADQNDNYLWRSLYYLHLKQCFEHIDKSRILVVNQDELKHSPNTLLSRIFEHAGLPPVDLSHLTKEQALEEFHSRYPNFESTTGWGDRGNDARVQVLPTQISDPLHQFFAPYNQKLFELLGVEPYPGWAV